MWYRCLDSHLRSVRPFVVVVCIEIGNAVGKCWARGFFRGHEKENEPKQEMKCETTTGVIDYILLPKHRVAVQLNANPITS